MSDALNKLCKWRMVLASWQLGTRPNTDPECQAVRDQRELLLLLRVEVNTLVNLLTANGVFTVEEFTEQCDVEAGFLDRAYEKQFPGATTALDGVHIDIAKASWMHDFPP